MEDYWEYEYDAAVTSLIEEGIQELRDEQIQGYLGTFGDAVQARIDQRLEETQSLIRTTHFGPAVVSAVIVAELAIRYFIVRPTLEGAFLSEEWARILVRRILSSRTATDRELLPAVLRTWNINLDALTLSNGKQLWSTFKSTVLVLRNGIVHKGAAASEEEALLAVDCAESILREIVAPLSDQFGFSWSQTKRWNPTEQGVGGAKAGIYFNSEDPFDPPGAE